VVLAVKAIADLEGVSVSTWIRSLVAREIERHRPPVTMPAADIQTSWEAAFGYAEETGRTVSSGARASFSLAT
jgi:hypothetical protein